MAMRARVLIAFLSLSACGPAPKPLTRQVAQAPASVAAPPPVLACNVQPANEAEVFTATWSAVQRATVLRALSRGVVAVRYTGCDLEVLPKCRAAGAYPWNTTAIHKELLRIRDADQLFRRFPHAGATLSGALQTTGEVWLEATIGGRYDLDRPIVHRDDLEGECSEATHVVSGVGVGAVRVRDAQKIVVAQDGDACPTELVSDVIASATCSSPVRLELVAVDQRRLCPPALEWNGKKCVARKQCPRGTTPEHGACFANGMTYELSPACLSPDAKGCAAECEKGNAGSCAEIAFRYWEGDGVGKDPARAVELATKACNASDLRGCSNLGVYHAHGSGSVKLDGPKALSILEKACGDGAPPACLDLGQLFEAGKVVAKDLARAAGFYAKGCDKGNGRACWQLGDALAHGDGVSKDDSLALQRYLRGCELGSPIACSRVAHAYDSGRGVAEQPDLAVAYGRAACDQGDARECGELGWMYADGRGVTKDLAIAASLYAMGCNGGSNSSCGHYGKALLYGLGVEPDARGKEYLRDACDKQDWSSCSVIAENMRDGSHGHLRDLPGSFALAMKACEGGSGDGCNVLGWAYEHGLGTPADKKKAIDTYRVACAKKNHHACANLDRLGAKK